MKVETKGWKAERLEGKPLSPFSLPTFQPSSLCSPARLSIALRYHTSIF
jgi:hypothetical protein